MSMCISAIPIYGFHFPIEKAEDILLEEQLDEAEGDWRVWVEQLREMFDSYAVRVNIYDLYDGEDPVWFYIGVRVDEHAMKNSKEVEDRISQLRDRLTSMGITKEDTQPLVLNAIEVS